MVKLVWSPNRRITVSVGQSALQGRVQADEVCPKGTMKADSALWNPIVSYTESRFTSQECLELTVVDDLALQIRLPPHPPCWECGSTSVYAVLGIGPRTCSHQRGPSRSPSVLTPFLRLTRY